MKIKTFEKFEVDLDVTYELANYNKFGEEIQLNIDDEELNNTNPFDLVEVVKLYMKYKKKYPNLEIKKVVSDFVDEKTIKDILVEIDSDKYNL